MASLLQPQDDFHKAERRVGLFLFCSSQICEDRAGNVSALSCKHSVKASDLSSESRNMKLFLKRKSYVLPRCGSFHFWIRSWYLVLLVPMRSFRTLVASNSRAPDIWQRALPFLSVLLATCASASRSICSVALRRCAFGHERSYPPPTTKNKTITRACHPRGRCHLKHANIASEDQK